MVGQRSEAANYDDAGRNGSATEFEARQQSLDQVVSRLSRGYRSLGDMAYEVLREAIVGGAFAPGEFLRQEALATAIGVSRLPVRSALMRLESEGLVDFHPRKGAVVRTLTHEQLREIYELRNLLEPYALRKSMARMTPDRLADLRRYAVLLDTQDEGDSFLDIRILFYRELYDATGAPRLVELIEGLRSSIGRYLLRWRVASAPDAFVGTHTELIEHVASGDIDAAEGWLRRHLRDVSEGVEKILAGEFRNPSTKTS
jgi:DNA-binding GntR family transcriptional regulator